MVWTPGLASKRKDGTVAAKEMLFTIAVNINDIAASLRMINVTLEWMLYVGMAMLAVMVIGLVVGR